MPRRRRGSEELGEEFLQNTFVMHVLVSNSKPTLGFWEAKKFPGGLAICSRASSFPGPKEGAALGIKGLDYPFRQKG